MARRRDDRRRAEAERPHAGDRAPDPGTSNRAAGAVLRPATGATDAPMKPDAGRFGRGIASVGGYGASSRGIGFSRKSPRFSARAKATRLAPWNGRSIASSTPITQRLLTGPTASTIERKRVVKGKH